MKGLPDLRLKFAFASLALAAWFGIGCLFPPTSLADAFFVVGAAAIFYLGLRWAIS